MSNTSESLISLFPYKSNSSSVLDLHEDGPEMRITQDEYNSITPYINEDELTELGPKARFHIIVSALACNLSTEQTTSNESNYSEEVLYCPQTFDSYYCWNETPAGETASAPCPWFVPGFEASRFAYKECLEDGSWFIDPLSNRTWSNYTNCVKIETLQVLPGVVSEVGNTISVFALILSLLIYCQFPSLSSPRATIHKHFLASFTIHNSLWLVWYRTVIKAITDDELNPVYCAMTSIMMHYFSLANHFWMFCEGFYLHLLHIGFSFSGKKSKLLKWFYIFGWLGPLIPLGFYTIFRATDADPNETKDCWIHDSKWSRLISVSECICLLGCLVIVINIVRVHVMKFHFELSITESVASDRSLRKAALTTLILIGLLGLEYLILPFKPDKESNKSEAATYNYVEELTTSFQGLAVSVILCFCKRQVRAILKRYVCRTKRLQTWFMRTFMTNANSGENRQNTRSTTMNMDTLDLRTHRTNLDSIIQ